MEQAILGIASCGHAVACDADVNAKNKAALARKGYDVVTVSVEVARERLTSDFTEHLAKCRPAKK